MPLFLFIFVLSQIITAPLFAQDLKNRTEEMYPFGTVIISSESLPDKVYKSQKNKILVSVLFLEKGTRNVLVNSVGSGFVTETLGIIITTRHLFDGPLVDMEKMKNEKIKFNPKFDFEYMFIGTIITDIEWIRFPLSLAAIGEKGTFKDMMALRADSQTMERARVAGDAFSPNPYSLLMKTSKFADADIGEKVYISGFAPGTGEYFDKNNKSIPFYVDLINHTFPAEVEVSLPEMPGNKTGVKIIYRLRNGGEPGFSGGKVINSQGEVIGMTIASSASRNFIYAISAKDIKDFLKDNKLK
ncbi:MAG: S1C family serine protease [Actinomycetota bacterium]|nr:S1C family serine protease [Actinomycetota bacterium]